MNRVKRVCLLFLTCMMVLFTMSACFEEEIPIQVKHIEKVSVDEIPAYADVPYVIVNDNQPTFGKEDITYESFEYYSETDELGRCSVAFANIGKDIMPTEKRGSIGQVKPTGWQVAKYDNVDGKYLYNRCHLIGYQLTGENANERNLITGTRYMNVEGMLPFENMVADYVKETNNHVLYRVILLFNEEDAVALGVQMEAYSVEDNGGGICFNVFVYNVQPGIIIDYATGNSHAINNNTNLEINDDEVEVRANRRSKIYHMPGQRAYEDMEHSNNLIIFHNEKEAIEAGYRKAQQ